MNYLPKDATIEQSCAWLQAETGQTWILPRLMECHLTPYFWLDYKPGYPRLFGDRLEGYQTRMVFQGDLTRLESDGGVAFVTMFTAHDDTLVKVEPGWPVPLSELRFKREAVERVAEIINRTKAAKTEPQADTTPAPVVEAPASEPIRYHLLATRAQLCAAFGVWGLSLGMFKNLTERQWLMDARKVKGQGQRGNIVEPLFCPFQVMRGLATKTKKPKFSEEKGWDILENRFRAVFDEYQQFDTREQAG